MSVYLPLHEKLTVSHIEEMFIKNKSPYYTLKLFICKLESKLLVKADWELGFDH